MYRLGFSYHQVAYEDDVLLGTDDVLKFTKIQTSGSIIEHHVIKWRGSIFSEQQLYISPLFMLLKSSYGSGYVQDDGVISTTRMTGDTGISNYIAYESPCSYLLLKSD